MSRYESSSLSWNFRNGTLVDIDPEIPRAHIGAIDDDGNEVSLLQKDFESRDNTSRGIVVAADLGSVAQRIQNVQHRIEVGSDGIQGERSGERSRPFKSHIRCVTVQLARGREVIRGVGSAIAKGHGKVRSEIEIGAETIAHY